jgi:hypothetical protein
VIEKYNYKTINDQIINNTFLYNSKIFHLYQEDSVELGSMNFRLYRRAEKRGSNDTAINPYSGVASIYRDIARLEGEGPLEEDLEFMKTKERLSISSMERLLLYSKNESYLSCCYIIKFNHNLYFYIGSTTKIMNRIHSHNTNVLNIVKNLPYIKKDCKLFDYFIKDEIRHKGHLSYKILPIYLGYNYLNKFLLLYPDYKLSRGEWILLSSITDFIIKLLEQSLINYFKPRLNELDNVAMRH